MLMILLAQSLVELLNINLLKFSTVRIAESGDKPRILGFRFITTAVTSFVPIKTSVKRRDRMKQNEMKDF